MARTQTVQKRSEYERTVKPGNEASNLQGGHPVRASRKKVGQKHVTISTKLDLSDFKTSPSISC